MRLFIGLLPLLPFLLSSKPANRLQVTGNSTGVRTPGASETPKSTSNIFELKLLQDGFETIPQKKNKIKSNSVIMSVMAFDVPHQALNLVKTHQSNPSPNFCSLPRFIPQASSTKESRPTLKQSNFLGKTWLMMGPPCLDFWGLLGFLSDMSCTYSYIQPCSAAYYVMQWCSFCQRSKCHGICSLWTP